MTEPTIIDSDLSGPIEFDDIEIDIHIYRLETLPVWSLEVVGPDGTSHVWDDTFATDQAAYFEF